MNSDHGPFLKIDISSCLKKLYFPDSAGHIYSQNKVQQTLVLPICDHINLSIIMHVDITS